MPTNEEKPPTASGRVESRSSSDVALLVAIGIHDARCREARTHIDVNECVKFYLDHAEAALAALHNAGYVLMEPVNEEDDKW